MAFPAKSTVQDINSKPDPKSDSATSGPSGPPPAAGPAAKPSLYASQGQAAMQGSQDGLGSEGSSPALIGLQGMTLVQRGIQMLNLAFPENPGLTATLADLTGRLQTLIPQLVAQSGNAGMGMLAQMAQGMPNPMQAMQQQMAPPIGGAPMGPPQGGGMPAPMGGPPMPPMQ